MIRHVKIAYHRNGIAGEGFYCATFRHSRQAMVAVVFDGPGRVAVFDLHLLAAGNITFGENSWRGDEFEPELREAIAAWEQKRLPVEAGETAPEPSSVCESAQCRRDHRGRTSPPEDCPQRDSEPPAETSCLMDLGQYWEV